MNRRRRRLERRLFRATGNEFRDQDGQLVTRREYARHLAGQILKIRGRRTSG